VEHNVSVRCGLCLTGETEWILVKQIGVGRECLARDCGYDCHRDCTLLYSSTPCVVVSVPDGESGSRVLFSRGLLPESLSAVTECIIPEVASWEGRDAACRVKQLERSMQDGLHLKGACRKCNSVNGGRDACICASVCGGSAWTVLRPCDVAGVHCC
jgi:hypothetical protein